MNRRGFTLLTVLWLLVALTSIAGATLAIARSGGAVTRNRVLLTRAAWARDACGEILLARYAEHPDIQGFDSVDLGRGTWCLGTLEDPSGKLDLNHAEAEALRTLLPNDSLVDALLDWRDPDDLPRPLGAEAAWYRAAGRRLPRNGPLVSVMELAAIRGFDSELMVRLQRLTTTRGTTRINLNAAPTEVLATIPELGPEVAELVARRRAAGERVQSLQDLLSIAPPDKARAIMRSYQDLGLRVSTAPQQLIAMLEGGVHGTALVARTTLTLAPSGGRLTVVRREAE